MPLEIVCGFLKLKSVDSETPDKLIYVKGSEITVVEPREIGSWVHTKQLSFQVAEPPLMVLEAIEASYKKVAFR